MPRRQTCSLRRSVRNAARARSADSRRRAARSSTMRTVAAISAAGVPDDRRTSARARRSTLRCARYARGPIAPEAFARLSAPSTVVDDRRPGSETPSGGAFTVPPVAGGVSGFDGSGDGASTAIAPGSSEPRVVELPGAERITALAMADSANRPTRRPRRASALLLAAPRPWPTRHAHLRVKQAPFEGANGLPNPCRRSVSREGQDQPHQGGQSWASAYPSSSSRSAR
jgi:hypothetical protein